jgi:hypothetical protein
VITVHNGVDFSNHEEVDLNRGVPEKVVTFLGRVTFQKGPDYFGKPQIKFSKEIPTFVL